MRRQTRRRWLVAGVGILYVVVGCRKVPMEPPALRSPEVVLRLPGDAPFSMTGAPDGTLFLATFRGSLYRSRDGGRAWEHIARQVQAPLCCDPPLLYLYAPSRTTLFAVEYGRAEVFRWDEGAGLRRESTPVTGRWRGCHHGQASASFYAVWGRSSREVYAVGGHGLVLRFDGERWVVEPNPLSASAPDICDAAYEAILRAVGGDERYVYAAGLRIMRRSRDGPWELLPPAERPDEISGVEGITSGSAGVVFGGTFHAKNVGAASQPLRFFRPVPRVDAASSGWENLWAGGPYTEFFGAGTSAPRGPAVFFERSSPTVLILDGRRLHRYRVEELSEIRGAAVAGRDLVVFGSRDTTTVVVRGGLP
jgi:hypothetical protein